MKIINQSRINNVMKILDMIIIADREFSIFTNMESQLDVKLFLPFLNRI